VLGAELPWVSVAALGSSLTGGASDFLSGTVSRRVGVLRFLIGSRLIAVTALGAAVVLFGRHSPSAKDALEAVTAGLALTVGLYAFIRASVEGPMTIVAPVSATGVVVPIAAGIVAGARPGSVQLAGIVAAVAGVAAVGYSPSAAVDNEPRTSGLGWPAVAALGTGAFFWLMALASRGDVLWSLFIVQAVPAACFAVVARQNGVRVLDLVRLGGDRAVVCSSLLGLSSAVLYALATSRGQLVIVSVLASLFPVVPVVLAYLLLHERVARTQYAGIGVVLMGIVMMGAG
jgi:drug/metabolite transporter (DMT)-like permease